MYFQGNMACCGVRELTDLSDSGDENGDFSESLKDLIWANDANSNGYFNDKYNNLLNIHDGGFKFVIFSEVTSHGYGAEFADFLTKHQLGTVVKTASAKNPNTGNRLTIYIWTVNHRNLSRWYRKRVKAAEAESTSPVDSGESEGAPSPSLPDSGIGLSIYRDSAQVTQMPASICFLNT